jgi:aspartyl-tRNA(Asn)/glutamyl-tRNA(Gln) amidotransferase subunit B
VNLDIAIANLFIISKSRHEIEIGHFSFAIGMLRRSLRLQRQLSIVSRVNSTCCSLASTTHPCRFYSSTTDVQTNGITVVQNYRQQNKLEHKSQKKKVTKSNQPLDTDTWELTVCIEIHAQLDTERKLFSSASTESSNEPNSQVALCDLAYPGAQPIFQTATLLPAIRVALALNCDIQRKSSFDRKHYFYADQPAGYQITQFYEPFARSGYLTLYRSDGIAKEDGDSITIGIKQIQLEQDTAKSLVQSDTKTLVDFNRVSHPLIEIISMPDIHHPATAAAYVRKIQSIVRSVGAVTTGMEAGGLRADVNVSVRQRGQTGSNAYYGVEGLGQRTEIKNLNSFKAIEDAVVAEKKRHIKILTNEEEITGETRGWTLGGKETHKLREKEGEDDYRYMPDPDLGTLIIPTALVEKLKASMPKLPDEVVDLLMKSYGLSDIDARTLLSFDDGDRLEYFYQVVHSCTSLTKGNQHQVGRIAGNLILHELGMLLAKLQQDWTPEFISPPNMSNILDYLNQKKISPFGAKQLLSTLAEQTDKSATELANELGLLKREVNDEQYYKVIDEILEAVQRELLLKVKEDPQSSKVGYLVGLCMSNFGKNGMVGAIDHKRLKDLIIQRVQTYNRTNESK